MKNKGCSFLWRLIVPSHTALLGRAAYIPCSVRGDVPGILISALIFVNTSLIKQKGNI